MELFVIVERGLRASVSMLSSLIFWYLIPSLLVQEVASPPPILSAGNLLIFALLIGTLSALSHAFDGGPMALVCGVGSNLATIIFLFLATAGGVLTFREAGITVIADFQPLLYLVMAPIALSIVRKVWAAISDSVGRRSEWVEMGGYP